MTKPSTKQYKKIVKKLSEKGFNVETKESQAELYKALESAGFKIKLKGETYSVYASRVIAMMHDRREGKALEL